MIARINFTKLTSFNIVLFTVVDDVKKLKDKMMEEGATHAQTGHFYFKSPQLTVKVKYRRNILVSS